MRFIEENIYFGYKMLYPGKARVVAYTIGRKLADDVIQGLCLSMMVINPL